MSLQELLKIQHAFTSSESSHALHDYNLLLFTGEIFFLQGLSGSGKSTVIRLLQGEIPLTDGSFSFQGEPVDPRARRDWLQRKICYLDSSNQIIDSLSVTENLLVLQQNTKLFQIYSRAALEKKAQELLDQAEIPIKANRSARRLSQLDRQKLCILKAELAGYSLVILDCTHHKGFISDSPTLGVFMKTLAAKGLSFLIVSDQQNAFADVADRFQIIHRGMDVRQWASGPNNRERLMPSAQFDVPAWSSRQVHEQTTCIGIQDHQWDPASPGKAIFTRLREEAPSLWKEHFNFEIPRDDSYHSKQLAWVPMGSEQMLFPNLDIGDNLLLTLYGRAGTGGVIPKGMKEFVMKEFRKEQALPDTVMRVDQLSTLQRKILSIYRLLLRKPQILVLESPLAGLSVADAHSLLLYLARLRASGIRLFILAQDLTPYLSLCDLTLIREADGQLKIRDYGQGFIR